MVASLNALKKSTRICPFSPIFPMTSPKTRQKIIKPKTLMPSEYRPTILYSFVLFYGSKPRKHTEASWEFSDLSQKCNDKRDVYM